MLGNWEPNKCRPITCCIYIATQSTAGHLVSGESVASGDLALVAVVHSRVERPPVGGGGRHVAEAPVPLCGSGVPRRPELRHVRRAGEPGGDQRPRRRGDDPGVRRQRHQPPAAAPGAEGVVPPQERPRGVARRLGEEVEAEAGLPSDVEAVTVVVVQVGAGVCGERRRRETAEGEDG